MREYVIIFILVVLATAIAVWIAPPFGSFALSDS